jgi:hypothetical protein
MSVLTIIETTVGNMDANGDSFTFLNSEREWQNLKSDDQTLPAVYLDMPIQFKPIIKNGGAFSRQYILVALFMYRSNIDDSPAQQRVNYLKAEEAQRNFMLLLDNNYGEDIEELTVSTCYQIRNLFDANLDGVVMPFSITLKDNSSVCL